jgi:hypothetical protein
MGRESVTAFAEESAGMDDAEARLAALETLVRLMLGRMVLAMPDEFARGFIADLRAALGNAAADEAMRQAIARYAEPTLVSLEDYLDRGRPVSPPKY